MSIAILLNGFIIFYSCLDYQTTDKWNKAVTNIFVTLINDLTKKEVKQIPLENIQIGLSNETDHKYNYVPGYNVDEIPLGSAKQINCVFSPEDATKKAISYTASPADAVQLNQSGSTVSVVGMKAGDVVITAKSGDGGFISSQIVKVVETVAPTNYKISLDDSENIALEDRPTIKFDIDGGVLGHNELINFRYYDTRKLIYSVNNDVVSVDNNGVIYPNHSGNATITVKNGEYSESININVSGSKIIPDHSHFEISGSDVCYANDMISDQNSKKNHYQLTPKNGDQAFEPEDFIWSSSNELLVRVDRHGVMRGFRKTSNQDENAIITAKSKYSGVKASFVVTVKNQLPNDMYFSFVMGDRTVWNPTEYTLSVGDSISLTIGYSPSSTDKRVIVECSDESIVAPSNEGGLIILQALKDGVCTIKITSIINPELTRETKYTVVNAGAIGTNDFFNLQKSFRKSIGHSAVFMIAQIFTYLALYMFFDDKKWWFYTSISLGEGLFLAGLSELIQFFIPFRDGTFIDILIDFAGVVVGAALTFLGIFIVKKIKEKQKAKKELEAKND